MTIRPAEPHDLPEILAVMRTAPWEKTGYLERALQRGDLLVADAGGTIAGYLVWNREFFSLSFIWLVTVLPEYRRRGVASALVDAVERRCAGSRLYSSTNRSNATMRRLFERRGYRTCGEVDVDLGDPETFYLRDIPSGGDEKNGR